jgi:uncharacterized membrane protein HdeD (DUF308 family)
MVAQSRLDPQTVAQRLGGAWGWVLFFGIVTLIAGGATLVWPGRTLVVIAVLFAVQLFVAGIFNLIRAISDRSESGGLRVLLAVLGVLSILVGVMLLQDVLQTLAVLTLLLGAYWVVHGIIEVMVGITDKTSQHRGLLIAGGALSAIAGIVVLGYPVQSVFALAIILGIWLLIYGVMMIVFAFQLRSAAHRGVSPAAPATA